MKYEFFFSSSSPSLLFAVERGGGGGRGVESRQAASMDGWMVGWMEEVETEEGVCVGSRERKNTQCQPRTQKSHRAGLPHRQGASDTGC